MTATIIDLAEIAALALYCESGIPIADCRTQTARRSVFFSIMRDPAAKAAMIALEHSRKSGYKQEN